MDTLDIYNFKCFRHVHLNLNKLTVLTGSNGSGKSSIVQSILLLHEIIKGTNNKSVQLNGPHALSLGTFDNICQYDNNEDVIKFVLNKSIEATLTHPYENNEGKITNVDDKTAFATLILPENTVIPTWLEQHIYYLNAERIGPRWESGINNTNTTGDRGEYSGNVLLSASYNYPPVIDSKLVSPNTAQNFNIQTDLWMSYICSDVSFKAEPITSEKCRVILRQHSHLVGSPNTGFGYTYSLPIILNGLQAPPSSLMIIENPEAHLHPKAQSNMGFFLAQMASAGIKIIVETHSEHIINGMRRAALSLPSLSPTDLTIYFSEPQNDPNKPLEITVDSDGNLSDFPIDFFDQARQDLLEIIRLSDKYSH